MYPLFIFIKLNNVENHHVKALISSFSKTIIGFVSFHTQEQAAWSCFGAESFYSALQHNFILVKYLYSLVMFIEG